MSGDAWFSELVFRINFRTCSENWSFWLVLLQKQYLLKVSKAISPLNSGELHLFNQFQNYAPRTSPKFLWLLLPQLTGENDQKQSDEFQAAPLLACVIHSNGPLGKHVLLQRVQKVKSVVCNWLISIHVVYFISQ